MRNDIGSYVRRDSKIRYAGVHGGSQNLRFQRQKKSKSPRTEAKRNMRRQYRHGKLKKEISASSADESTGGVGEVFRQIAMRSITYYGLVRDYTVDEMAERSEKVTAASSLAELEAIYPVAEDVKGAIKILNETMLEFVNGEPVAPLGEHSADFLIDTLQYAEHVLYGADYPEIRRNVWPWIEQSEIADELVRKVFQKMHLAWLEKNLQKCTDLKFKPFWGEFVGFHVAGTKALERYAAILVPILLDLGMSEAEASRCPLKWYKEYQKELRAFLEENHYQTRQQVENDMCHNTAKFLDGLPDWMCERLHYHYVTTDDGRCSAAVAANIQYNAGWR